MLPGECPPKANCASTFVVSVAGALASLILNGVSVESGVDSLRLIEVMLAGSQFVKPQVALDVGKHAAVVSYSGCVYARSGAYHARRI